MIAVDTNVLVRLLTGDEPKQAAAARRLFASQPIWIAKTVLLETGWVLRSLYGFEQSAIREAFTKLLPQYETNPKLFCELELTKTMSVVLTNVGEKKILPTRAGGKSVELRLMLNNEPPQPKSAANP